MEFYKVDKEADQLKVTKDIFLVANELITQKEAEKFGFIGELKRNSKKVKVSKLKTYWFFGCRFEKQL